MSGPPKNDVRVVVDFANPVPDTIRTASVGWPGLVPQSSGGSSSLVVSQIYGNGGTPGATYSSNYVELFNRSASVVDLLHWTVRMEGINVSASLNFAGNVSIPIQPGQYFLIQIGTDGPTGMPVPADITVHAPFSPISSSGRIFLVKPNGVAGSGSCPPNSDIADFVGYGDSAGCFEGSGPAPAINNTVADLRKFQGCGDSDDNSNDFQLGTPSPHNRSSPFAACGSNPIDTTDFFVRQHYLDFLNRQPDSSGLAFWINNINNCSPQASCIDVQRINTSAAFFVSIEFQNTGYLVYRIYKAAYGNLTSPANAPVPIRFSELLPDTQEIGAGVVVGQGNWQQQLEANKQAFTLEFVQRARFASAYSTSLTPNQFVDTLFTNAGVTPAPGDRNAAISEFGSASNTSDVNARSRALRDVAENATLNTQEFNKAFVLMQYFGYLRRNPYDPPESTLDYSGYNFWLNKLNQFNGNYINAEMVKGFITSSEYRQRFGP